MGVRGHARRLRPSVDRPHHDRPTHPTDTPPHPTTPQQAFALITAQLRGLATITGKQAAAQGHKSPVLYLLHSLATVRAPAGFGGLDLSVYMHT